MERLEGKIAVVTGASAGIGASIATALVEHGMTVIGLARRSEAVEELSKSLVGKKGKLHAFKADISKANDVVEAFQWIQKTFGPPQVLINNAGYAPFSSLSNLQRDDYEKIQLCFDTNVMGVIMCTNEAIKLMKEGGIHDGHIVNINSVVGHYVTNNTGFFAYNASKNALRVITEGLRRELAEAKSKIRVSSISPGFVTSEMGIKSGIPNLNELIAKHPFLDPKNVASSVIHALSAPPNVQIAEVVVRPLGPGKGEKNEK
ncbi:farnesol dehydrogenase-like [Ischnura elegans]|uniref:farnesol dehydrogenase-like n=1 Tax=Ischnura elegans TaxID=197161 RepID=UPI001ED8ADF2|nr:farnesol dehydrogenase-like [Ischnura elegans]